MKTYYGLTELTFKDRWNGHKSSFHDPEQLHSTSLSTYLAKCTSDGHEQEITWSIKAKAHPMPSGGKQCDLCLIEKLIILMAGPRSTLNKCDEIMTKWMHKRKYLLGTVKPPEPPNPT